MTEQQKEFFGKGINLELWKQEIEKMREQKTEDVPFDGLTESERQAIKEQGEKAMQDYNDAVLSYLEKIVLPSISFYQIGNKVCRNNISCILTEPYIKEANGTNSVYSGIPLTKKELDALGYEGDRITFQKGEITIGWYADNNFCYLPSGNIGDTRLKIEFVHQLQNLETLLNSK